MDVSDWSRTCGALEVLRQSLCCSLCSGLLKEPCTLGSCDHLFCRCCVGDHVGNSCPVCHVQAWAKELQVKRDLANVVKLYHKMCRLVDPSKTPAPKGPGRLREEHSQDEVDEVAGSLNGFDDDCEQSAIDRTNQCGESVDKSSNLVSKQQLDTQQVGTQQVGLQQLGTQQVGSQQLGTQWLGTQQVGSQQVDLQQVNGTQQRNHLKKVVKTVVGKHGKLSCIVKFVGDEDVSTQKKQTHHTSRAKGLVKVKTKGNKSKIISPVKPINSSSESMTDSVSDSGSVEEADSSVFDFIASPARPKPPQKRKAKKVDPKVLRARRVAAANKKWSKSSKVTKNSKKNVSLRHVSFREDTDSDTRTYAENSVESMDTGSDSMWDDVEADDDHMEAVESKKVASNSVSLQGGANSSRISDAPTCTSTPGPNVDNNTSVTKKKGRRKSDSKSPVRSSPSGKENASGMRDKGVSPGKTPAKRNIRGETPLHIAAIKGDVSAVEEFLKEGADPNIKDNAGWMPLHEACNHGHRDCVAILIDHGALINAPGFEHDSPLHDAVTNNRVEVVKLLVERGASLKLRNMHGLTPGDYARTEMLKAALNTKQLVTDSPMTALKVHPATNQPPVFFTTGLNKPQRTKLDSCVKLLNGRIVADFHSDVTHLIAACPTDQICLRTIKYLQAILTGKWVVSFAWVTECLKRKQRVNEGEYEVIGTTLHPTSYGPSKGRDNTLNQCPGLFDGCNFFFYGTYKSNPSKKDLIELIKCGGGSLVQRQPKPDDDVIQTSTTMPYHVNQDSQLANCSYFIIYDQTTTRVPPKVNTGKVCTASVFWLMKCISNFTLLDLDQ